MSQFSGFTPYEGTLFPPELREVVPKLKTVAELKLLLIILDAYFQAGLDAQPMTFDQLKERTNLARQSVSDGIKKLLRAGYVHRLTAGDTYAYEPSLKTRLPCHDSFDKNLDSHDNNETHAWQSRICTALIQEFGVASRVAEDIAFKRDPQVVQRQIDYARFELGNGFRPQRPAGYIVARIRDNRPKPLGYEDQTSDDPLAAFGLGEIDPTTGLPRGTDGHQVAVDKANGRSETDANEVGKHLFWGFEGGMSDLPQEKIWAKWREGGKRLLDRLPADLELQIINQRIDTWFTLKDCHDAFWQDNPLCEVGLDTIARFVKNGGPNGPHRPSDTRSQVPIATGLGSWDDIPGA